MMAQQYRNGDVVLVRGTVEKDQYGIRERVSFGGYEKVDLHLLDIAKVERRNFHVGDRVLVDGGNAEWAIRALADEHAWLSRDDGEFATVWIPKLTWLPPEEPTDEDIVPPPAPVNESEAA